MQWAPGLNRGCCTLICTVSDSWDFTLIISAVKQILVWRLSEHPPSPHMPKNKPRASSSLRSEVRLKVSLLFWSPVFCVSNVFYVTECVVYEDVNVWRPLCVPCGATNCPPLHGSGSAWTDLSVSCLLLVSSSSHMTYCLLWAPVCSAPCLWSSAVRTTSHNHAKKVKIIRRSAVGLTCVSQTSTYKLQVKGLSV